MTHDILCPFIHEFIGPGDTLIRPEVVKILFKQIRFCRAKIQSQEIA